jgi:hypothetical protein
MLGHSRLSDPEGLHEIAYGALVGAQELDNPPPVRLGEDLERGHYVDDYA